MNNEDWLYEFELLDKLKGNLSKLMKSFGSKKATPQQGSDSDSGSDAPISTRGDEIGGTRSPMVAGSRGLARKAPQFRTAPISSNPNAFQAQGVAPAVGTSVKNQTLSADGTSTTPGLATTRRRSGVAHINSPMFRNSPKAPPGVTFKNDPPLGMTNTQFQQNTKAKPTAGYQPPGAPAWSPQVTQVHEPKSVLPPPLPDNTSSFTGKQFSDEPETPESLANAALTYKANIKNKHESKMRYNKALLNEWDYLRYYLEKMEEPYQTQKQELDEKPEDLDDDMLMKKDCRIDPMAKGRPRVHGKPVLLGWEDV